MSEITDVKLEHNESPDKLKVPYKGHMVLMDDVDTDSPVFDIKGFRGIGLNLPALAVVADVSIYVSPTPIALGEDDSLMALLDGQTFTPDASERSAFSTAFPAEHYYCQFIYNAAETTGHEVAVTFS